LSGAGFADQATGPNGGVVFVLFRALRKENLKASAKDTKQHEREAAHGLPSAKFPAFSTAVPLSNVYRQN
jgi:hypothetical protein